jgi:Cu/Ag efflux protein CusF
MWANTTGHGGSPGSFFANAAEGRNRMKNGWGWMAGIGAAGLLVAGAPAYAGDKAAGSTGSAAETKSERDATLGTGSGSMGSTGSAESTPGAAGTTDPSMGSTGSSSTMGSAEHHAAMGSTGQNQVTGKVDKIDKSNNELTLSLKVSDSTQVKKDGQTASLTDIKEGDQVRASFSGSGESLQVTEIEVMSSGAAGSTGTSSDPGTSGSTGTSADSPGTSGSGSTGLETPPSSGSTGSSPSDTPKSGSSGSRGY